MPSCRARNTSKHSDEITGWLRRKRLNEGASLLRRIEIRAQLTAKFPAS